MCIIMIQIICKEKRTDLEREIFDRFIDTVFIVASVFFQKD